MQVILEDVRFFGRHGVFDQETVCGNEFAVDVSINIPYSVAMEESAEEKLEDTISYADIYSIVAEEMGKPRKLLETVATSIARILKNRYPQITDGNIKITKVIPPIAGIVGRAAVNLKF